VDRVLPRAPPSCFYLEVEDDEEVSWPGWCWAAPAGLRPGTFFSYFFLFHFFSFIYLFSVFEIQTDFGILFLQALY
jgi:hypothetical protein